MSNLRAIFGRIPSMEGKRTVTPMTPEERARCLKETPEYVITWPDEPGWTWDCTCGAGGGDYFDEDAAHADAESHIHICDSEIRWRRTHPGADHSSSPVDSDPTAQPSENTATRPAVEAPHASCSDGSETPDACPKCGGPTWNGLHRNGYADCVMAEVEVHP